MTIAKLIAGRSDTVFTTTATTLVRDAVAQLNKHHIGALPVFDGADVAGIFSERDVIHHLAERGPAVLDLLAQLHEQAQVAGVDLSICGEAASRPLEAIAFAGLGYTCLSMPASSILPIKAMLSDLDLTKFRPYLTSLRRTSGGAPSLREPIAAWAREHGVRF